MIRSRLVAVAVLAALPACNIDPIDGPAPGTVLVTIQNTSFEPDTVTVPVGRSVRWTNLGTMIHTVVSDTSSWQSELLYPNSWFEVRFDAVGTFDYHSSIDTTMTGTVIVQ